MNTRAHQFRRAGIGCGVVDEPQLDIPYDCLRSRLNRVGGGKTRGRIRLLMANNRLRRLEIAFETGSLFFINS